MKKIALLGTAPSSRNLAPFSDSSWEMWSCSPGNMDVPRCDVFFEIHSMTLIEREPSYPPFIAYMKKLPLVYLQKEHPDFPTSKAYPLAKMVEKFGRYFFTSSLSYMMAMAIEEKPEAIGIFGVDMSATDEYGYQRAGMHYFLQKAEDAGIKLVVPPESDLLEPLPMYGFKEANRQWRKMYQRKLELEGELAKMRAERNANAVKENQFIGAMSDLEYMMNTFPNGTNFSEA